MHATRDPVVVDSYLAKAFRDFAVSVIASLFRSTYESLWYYISYNLHLKRKILKLSVFKLLCILV